MCSGLESDAKLERHVLACCNFSFLAGMLHDSYLLGKIYTNTHSISKTNIIYYISNVNTEVSRIPALQNLLLSWASGYHGVAGCFQTLLRVSPCTERQEPCAKLTKLKENGCPQCGHAKTSSINIPQLPVCC